MNPLLIRRRGMMKAQGGGVVNPYIQNGLVFWLDGIEKGGVAGAWKDLIGGVVFTANGAVATANGWETGQNKFLVNSDNLVFNYSDNTIEVVFTRNGSIVEGQVDMFSILDSSSLCFSFSSALIYISRTSASGTKFTRSLQNARSYCICAYVGSMIINGAKITSTSADYIGSSTYNAIGSRGNGKFPLNGMIYSIRVYNRHLDDTEIAHNQHVDDTRFNLGLNL